MSALLRDSALGQLIRLATKNKVLLYPEERSDFQCPGHYSHPTGQEGGAAATKEETESRVVSNNHASLKTSTNDEKPPLPKAEPIQQSAQEEAPAHRPESIEEPSPSPAPTEKDFELAPVTTARTGLSRVDTRVTMERIHTRRDLEQAYTTATLEKGPTVPIIPEKLDDGTILVDWYNTDDPDNPQNWSLAKKNFVTFQIW